MELETRYGQSIDLGKFETSTYLSQFLNLLFYQPVSKYDNFILILRVYQIKLQYESIQLL